MTASPLDARELADRTAGLLDGVRARRPRVHAITNAAAQVFTANLLLAAGAIPSLTVSPEEAPAFAGRADALVVNLGTLDSERRGAIPWAVAAARQAGKPWLLDPVFVDASPPRLALARLCLAGRPAVLRCNAAEFAALAEREASPENAGRFAAEQGIVVALTGPVDWIADGERTVGIRNGHPLMTRVTAMGCAATALLAAFAALEPDPLVAAAAGLLAVGVAGEIAGERAAGPGSFQPAFLDALDALDRAALADRARLA
ncbi:MAG TPA: hydroxyethylthiazole kinase [Beijerinckiaceae bacterium]|nr:hydroxyethylthiazole kinase [Beijerinckiaceae bacterium]